MPEWARSRTRIRAEVGNLGRLLTAPALARAENEAWRRCAGSALELLDRIASAAGREGQAELLHGDGAAHALVQDWLVGRRPDSPASAIAVAVGLEQSAEPGGETPLSL